MTQARLAASASALLLSTTFLVGACDRGQAQTSSAATPPATSGPGAEAFLSSSPQQTTSATGTVLETMNAGGYTYCRLQTDKEEVWIAATEFPAKKGDRLTVSLEMPMRNFHSNTLNRDFAVIYFVPAVAKEGQALPPVAGGAPAAAHGGETPGATAPTSTVVEPIAPPAGGMAIADLLEKRAALAGKSVVVRGKVVKVNNGIMDRNWFHLQDGSGSADKGTHDITVTSAATVALGDVVTVTGILATNKDFGAGYAYDAILEQATVKK